jgi:hypothetical protein
MKNLSNDCSIVIKEADKGNSVVIMDSEFYKNEILSMLTSDESLQGKFPKPGQEDNAESNIKYLLLKHMDTTFPQ